MKIKKNLVAATAAVLAAGMALAGCGSSNGGSGDVQKTADGKVKITMWHGFSEADGKTLESIVDDFNKSQDKYEIDAQLQPWSTIGETMVTKVTTGDGPDFVTTGADNGQGWSIDGTFQCVSDFYADKNNGTDDYLGFLATSRSWSQVVGMSLSVRPAAFHMSVLYHTEVGA